MNTRNTNTGTNWNYNQPNTSNQTNQYNPNTSAQNPYRTSTYGQQQGYAPSNVPPRTTPTTQYTSTHGYQPVQTPSSTQQTTYTSQYRNPYQSQYSGYGSQGYAPTTQYQQNPYSQRPAQQTDYQKYTRPYSQPTPTQPSSQYQNVQQPGIQGIQNVLNQLGGQQPRPTSQYSSTAHPYSQYVPPSQPQYQRPQSYVPASYTKRRTTSERPRGGRRRRSPPRRKYYEKSPSREPDTKRRKLDKPYSIKFNEGNISQIERQYIDIHERYPKLYISQDFTRVIHHWVNTVPKNASSIPLNKVVKIECDNESSLYVGTETIRQAPNLAKGIKHNSKVMLFSGAENVNWESMHITRALHFLVGKKDRSGLMCIGGSWQIQDGTDPMSDETLIRTAIRTTKDFCGIDLSKCTKWIKFIEIWYHRPAETIQGNQYPEMDERTVIFIPDVWNIIPTREEFENVLNKRREMLKTVREMKAKEEKGEEKSEEKSEEKKEQEEHPDDIDRELPTDVTIFADTTKDKLKNGITTMIISLDGLLDYNIGDKLEKTFEVSLFAEAFQEMLQRKYGLELLETLKKSVEKKSDEIKLVPEEPKKILVDSSSLAAFRYFDRSNLGYIYAEDLEALIHGLGQGLSKGYVRDLLREVVDTQSHKLTYEPIAKQTETTNTVPPATTTQTENVQQTAENV